MKVNTAWAKYRANLRYDLPAALVVFLVALPLCLGIALASDAPLFSGIITGTIGGLVVGLLSGSELSVSGPAAGLTVIVASGIHTLGSFEMFLLALCLAGCFQILLGLMRTGFLATLFPNSVVKGMLAAIGITIILKQAPHAFGSFGRFESDMAFWDIFTGHRTIDTLRQAINSVHISAVLICAASLAILAFWDTKTIKSRPWLARIPGPLVAVAFASAVNQIFAIGFPSLELRAENGHLVQLPGIDSWSALVGELRHPHFTLAALMSPMVWTVALTLAAVGSVETLLCIESTDKLDPLKRISNTNRELIAQGVGNLLAGLVGGIPMTSVIVRSSANLYAGARTRMSAILHGAILMTSAVAIGSILNMIPLAALAAVLLSVGYKLAHPKLMKAIYKEGYSQFIPFCVTIAAIIFTDLLKGVAIGLFVGLFYVVKASYHSAIRVVRDQNDVLIRFSKDVTFIHKIKLSQVLAEIDTGCRVLIDATPANFIDHDVYELIRDFAATAKERGIHVEMKNFEVRRRHKRPIPPILERGLSHGIAQEVAARKPRLGARQARAEA